jgi:hypothetical protein
MYILQLAFRSQLKYTKNILQVTGPHEFVDTSDPCYGHSALKQLCQTLMVVGGVLMGTGDQMDIS